MKNLSTAINRMAEGRDDYVELTDPDRKRAVDFISKHASTIGAISCVLVEDDGWGTYNVSITVGEVALNDEEVADRICHSLRFKGNRVVDLSDPDGAITVHLDGVRADKIGL